MHDILLGTFWITYIMNRKWAIWSCDLIGMILHVQLLNFVSCLYSKMWLVLFNNVLKFLWYESLRSIYIYHSHTHGSNCIIYLFPLWWDIRWYSSFFCFVLFCFYFLFLVLADRLHTMTILIYRLILCSISISGLVLRQTYKRWLS